MSVNIVLFEPEIPPNTGNIARTCAVAGCNLHLIEPLGFSIDEKAVRRAGLDYWEDVNIEVHASFDAFYEKYGDKPLYFCSTKGQKVYSDVSYEEECYLIFGRESSGLPKDFYERFKDQLIKIPLLDLESARSLNLSNAAAIITYEVLRQHGFPGLI